MNKYIPVDKLTAEIENIHSEASCEYNSNKSRYSEGALDVIHRISCIVTSLQQEHQSPHWIHANYSSKPEIRYSPSGDPYLQSGSYMIWLSDLVTLPKDGTDLTNPGPEHQEMELEKEVKHFIEQHRSEFHGYFDISKVARHFAEWGAIHLNTRK